MIKVTIPIAKGPLVLKTVHRINLTAEIIKLWEGMMSDVSTFYGQGLLPAYREVPESKEIFDINGQTYAATHLFDSGGAAEVFLAKRDSFSDRVIIKRLREAHIKDAAHTARFKREADLSARKIHPGIVSAIDGCFGTNHLEEYLIVFPFMRGMSLSDFVKMLAANKRKLTAAQALVIMIYLSKILTVLNGILHCDLKSDNFMLVPGHPNRIVLIDFGLSMDLAEPRPLAQKGEILGHPDYLAPELAPEGSINATVQSEIFALGVSLIKMFYPELVRFTTRDEFESFVANSRAGVLTDDLRAGIPELLIPLLEMMVTRDLEERLDSFSQFNVLCQHLLYQTLS